MSHLLREHAPITETAWQLIDDEAREPPDAGARCPEARRLLRPARLGVLGDQPRSYDPARRSTGRRRGGAAAPVLAVVELRAAFTVVARRAAATPTAAREDVDLAALDEAAHRLASAENRAVFHGFDDAGITGITEASPRTTRSRWATTATATRATLPEAVEALLRAGIDGPYGLALGPEAYTRVLETTEHGGYPLLDHLREIIGGPLVWAPGVEGAVVVSQRGGDFLFDVGRGPLGRLRVTRRRRG